MSRDLGLLLRGGFGNVIFVFDGRELGQKFGMAPVQHPGVGDEFEERIDTTKIPASFIRGVIFAGKAPPAFVLREWDEKVSYPVLHLSKEEGWKVAGPPSAARVVARFVDEGTVGEAPLRAASGKASSLRVYRDSDGVSVSNDEGDFLLLGPLGGYRLTKECRESLGETDLPIWRIRDVEVAGERRRQGIGLSLYEKAFEAVAPAVVVSGGCTGMGTTPAAQAVWRRLRQRYSGIEQVSKKEWLVRLASGRTAAPFVDEGMVGEDWGSSASGLLVTDGDRVLLLKRSPYVQDPGLWGIPGGAIPVDYGTGKRKDAKRSALDEAREEMGGIPSGSVGGKHVFRKPSGFTFTTFVWETDRDSLSKFRPRLNWEHTDWGLFDLGDMKPTGIHPGVVWVLKRMGP